MKAFSWPVAPLAIGLLAGFLCCQSARAQSASCTGAPQGSPGDFDYYLLSLSLAPSFCDTAPGAARQKNECCDGAAADYQAHPVTVHGLWPNKDSVSNDQQPRYCSDEPAGRLPDSLYSNLKSYMPGVADGLENCEWSKHGVCSGLPYEQYYQAVVNLMSSIENAIGSTLRDNNMLGAEVKLADLVAKIAEKDPSLASAITFDCKQTPARDGGQSRFYIVEMRIYLSKDLSNSTSIPFDSKGGHLNSGCRAWRWLHSPGLRRLRRSFSRQIAAGPLKTARTLGFKRLSRTPIYNNAPAQSRLACIDPPPDLSTKPAFFVPLRSNLSK